MKAPKTYKYEWKTAEEVIANIDTVVKFPTFGVGSVAKKTGGNEPRDLPQGTRTLVEVERCLQCRGSDLQPRSLQQQSRLGWKG